MIYLFSFFCFCYGAVFGSFIDTAAERWGQDKSMFGRSHCVVCGYLLRWKDLFPLLSFLYLRGRCAKCGVRIPRRHLFVETLSGVVFAVLFLSMPLSKYVFTLNISADIQLFGALIFLWFVASAILIIIFSDARFYIIPDAVSLPATAIVLFISWASDYFHMDFLPASMNLSAAPFAIMDVVVPPFTASVVGAFLASGFFFSVSFVSRGRWMGWGDGKLALFLGALFGWPFVVPVVFMGFLLGSFVGIFLMLKKEATMKSLLPFGVFLGISALFFLVFQNTSEGQMFKLFVSSFFSL